MDYTIISNIINTIVVIIATVLIGIAKRSSEQRDKEIIRLHQRIDKEREAVSKQIEKIDKKHDGNYQKIEDLILSIKRDIDDKLLRINEIVNFVLSREQEDRERLERNKIEVRNIIEDIGEIKINQNGCNKQLTEQGKVLIKLGNGIDGIKKAHYRQHNENI